MTFTTVVDDRRYIGTAETHVNSWQRCSAIVRYIVRNAIT